jgi:peptidylprolyl isomerase
MTQAQQGNIVRVHYTGRLDDGSVFDSSEGGEPLEFTIGQGQMIPGFEQGVVGMELGESRTVTIAADQAYGVYQPQGVIEVDRSEIPPTIQLEVGLQLQATGPDGRPAQLTVIELSEDKVKMDGNHPLAGKDLTFEIEVIGIR